MRASKDAALALALRRLLNGRLTGIGEITDASLDTGRRRVQLRIALRGERDPVDVEIRGYDIEQADGENWVTVGDVVASREWLSAALHRFAVGRRFPIPANAAKVLRLLT